jgi:hypothetical protein
LVAGSEQLRRYIARPAVSEKRLSLLNNGHVRYELKTPYRDGTTHVIFEPMDFIARLVALVPKPRVNLTRFHGVFAPNSAHRAQVTPAKRGKGNKTRTADAPEATTAAGRSRHPASRDIRTSMYIIACIEDPVVIDKILTHLDKAAGGTERHLPPCRAPPQVSPDSMKTKSSCEKASLFA